MEPFQASPPGGTRGAGFRARWIGRRALRGALLTALFVAITLGMFFGLGRKNGRPTLGDLDETWLVASPDGPLVIWILSWSAHALVEQPLDLFDANMFHPNDQDLAYTESMVGLAPLYALLVALSGDRVHALNLFLLLLTVLNMWGGYALAKWLTGRTDAAVLAAALFAFNGYASAQRVHLQLQAMFLVPIALLLLFKWLERRRWRDALLFALTSAVLSVSVVYYGFMLLLIVAVVLGLYLVARRFRPGRRFVSGLLAAGLLSAVLVAPFGLAYLRLDNPDRQILYPGFALHVGDLVTPSVGSLLYRPLEAIGPPHSEEHRHFPGFLAIVLALVGLWVAVRGGRGAAPDGDRRPLLAGERRLYLLLLASAGAFCLLLAFGDELQGVPLPYAWLHEHVPGFSGVRVPSRIAFGTQLAAMVLAAVGYARLTAELAGPGATAGRRLAGRALAVAAVAVVLLENASQTRAFDVDYDPADAAVNRALADKPDGAVVELPIPPGVGPQPARTEAMRLMHSIDDWKPRVNGYAAGYPVGYFARARELEHFPKPRALRVLCELGVRYVVLRVGEPTSHRPFTMAHAADVIGRLPPRARWEMHGDDVLVDFEDWLAVRRDECR